MRILVLAFGMLLASQSVFAANTRVSIRNSNDRYLSAEGGGGSHLYGNRSRALTWERFLIVDLNGGELMSGDQICIETWNRHYITAEGGGGREMRANRTNCGAWEKFRIHRLDDNGRFIGGAIVPTARVAFSAANGNFVVVERDSNGSVMANRTSVGEWERFVLFRW